MIASEASLGDHGSMRLRWPRYSEHRWLQRARIVAVIAGAAVFLTVLISLLT